jgi:hypothetical protein
MKQQPGWMTESETIHVERVAEGDGVQMAPQELWPFRKTSACEPCVASDQLVQQRWGFETARGELPDGSWTKWTKN